MTLTAEKSSRTSSADAGWSTGVDGTWRDLMAELPKQKRRSWFNPVILWRCRNDPLARWSDPVPFERSRWIGDRSHDDLTVDLRGTLPGDFSFLLMGDTGEGDNSQYAVVPPVVAQADDTAFLVLCSDVLYPLGDVNDYDRKFYRPYAGYPGPVYGLPGNHDWYDDLAAFQYHLCGITTPLPRASIRADRRATGHGWARVVVRRLLWRRPRRPDDAEITVARNRRAATGQGQPVPQPGPYHVLDAGPVRLVCIDTGILGDVDEEQAEWLLEVSRDPRPKLLLTGKPVVVDGEVHGCELRGQPEGFATVLDVVHHAPFHYLGTVGGDIHNYQRYPVRLPDGRQVQHVVSGGGGAFMHATHLIGNIDESDAHRDLGVTEQEFKCYPWRRDSLAAYSHVLQSMLDRWHIPFRAVLTDEQAAAFVYDRIGLAPTGPREVAHRISRRQRAVAAILVRFGGQQFHKWFSPFFDWDDPPFFKNFLRFDVRGDAEAGSVQVTCFGVTGHLADETDTPVADRFELTWGGSATPAAPA